ncbi:hypothetical protein NA78x_003598 [Anatilimnocola sp. NA78]|uniref:hypothetical protein n=1 Tax=Anatilimnocola sp. NA78 TaxID=3415683 RepID=UPI003CE4D3CB
MTAGTTSPPPTSPSTAAEVAAAASEPVVATKKSKSPLLIIGATVGLILVVGIAAAAFLLRSGPAVVEVAASAPVAADPGPPPALPAFVPSTATKEATGDASNKLITGVLAASVRMQSGNLVGAGEAAAPPSFIVRGGATGEAAALDLPNHERWELQFANGTTLESYARQLDYFQIELGVIGGAPTVTYLSDLSKPQPPKREAPGSADSRLYLIWQRGPMQEADEILVKRAGLDPAGKVLAHFVPPAMEAEMLRVEAEQARVNKFTRIRRTVFGIEAAGPDAFRLIVTQQKGE